jgi:hypothetical protein
MHPTAIQRECHRELAAHHISSRRVMPGVAAATRKKGDAAVTEGRGVSPPVDFRPSSVEEELHRARALDGRAVVERAVADRPAVLILAFPDGQVAGSDADDIGHTIRRESVGDCAGVNRPRGRDALAP